MAKIGLSFSSYLLDRCKLQLFIKETKWNLPAKPYSSPGIVSLREKDPRTAFSYLYEAFEAFHVNKDESTHTSKDYCYTRALSSLRCQLLCRIMQDQPEGVKTIVQQKNMLNYQGEDSVQAILKIAAAYEDRSLKKLEKVHGGYFVRSCWCSSWSSLLSESESNCDLDVLAIFRHQQQHHHHSDAKAASMTFCK